MPEGKDACLLPWQRAEIRRSCGEISASVRSRGAFADTKKLTLAGPVDSDFVVARAMALNFIALNFSKNIKNLDDVPDNIRTVLKTSSKARGVRDTAGSDGPPVQPKHPPPVQPKHPPPPLPPHLPHTAALLEQRHVQSQLVQNQLSAQQHLWMINQQPLAANPPSIAAQQHMVAQQQQLVAQHQQLIAQQQHMLQQCPGHPLAMEMQQQSMAMMAMMMGTIAQQSVPTPTMQWLGMMPPMGYPGSTPLLRPPAPRGNEGIIGIHMKQIIWNEE